MRLVTCEQATTLALAALDRPLTRGERLRLTCHRLLCAPCRIYKRQLLILRAMLRSLPAAPSDTTASLPAAARARLRERLQAAQDDNQPSKS